MDDEKFKKLDDAWMKELEGLRKEPLPPELTRGFAESVEARIRQKGVRPQKRLWARWQVPVPVLVPVFAVVLIAAAITLRNVPTFEVPAPAEDLGTEIALLAELGEWELEDADEAAVIEETLTEFDV